ncbi:MAG: hypothetical protein IPQ05_14400 [Leptospiraceae bacterium]|nr:hypothetical protein [Leptospiraceae bacterium]
MNQKFLLDTNVLSELMRTEPEKKVLDCFEANTNNLFLVTRNEKDFLWIDNLSIVNPWDFDISKKK